MQLKIIHPLIHFYLQHKLIRFLNSSPHPFLNSSPHPFIPFVYLLHYQTNQKNNHLIHFFLTASNVQALPYPFLIIILFPSFSPIFLLTQHIKNIYFNT
jgi:hypothetical protein